ncbi:MAG: hypothetical protein EOP34_00770 [Rickettsiales bacterium]|nr:MAG: hypothetical protein EOP34_00770 [Rickettsiales bacterium]
MRSDMRKYLSQAQEMSTKMADLKKLHNVNFILDKQGNTTLDVPENMPEDQAMNLVKRFDIMDRVYLSQMKEYNDLVNKYTVLKNDVLFEGIQIKQKALEASHAKNFTKE